jgi:hypothetical protein
LTLYLFQIYSYQSSACYIHTTLKLYKFSWRRINISIKLVSESTFWNHCILCIIYDFALVDIKKKIKIKPYCELDLTGQIVSFLEINSHIKKHTKKHFILILTLSWAIKTNTFIVDNILQCIYWNISLNDTKTNLTSHYAKKKYCNI